MILYSLGLVQGNSAVSDIFQSAIATIHFEICTFKKTLKSCNVSSFLDCLPVFRFKLVRCLQNIISHVDIGRFKFN